MASKRLAVPAKHLFNGFRSAQQTAPKCFIRSMATEAPLPSATVSKAYLDAHLDSAPTEPILRDELSIPPPTPASEAYTVTAQQGPPQNPFLTTTQCTLYNFPSMEPTNFISYPSTHLLLPLRKDLLHRAVVYEGDMTRSGTANTKWRSEVHGSNRKIRPQKGTGSARLGNKKSPMLKGGGVAFGPKPRDFSTELPRKVYDKAWRTALSFRYKKGQLIVLDGEAEIDISPTARSRYMRDLLRWHGMGNPDGRTLFVTSDVREGLFTALENDNLGREGRALTVEDVDVKDLLELGRVVVERSALEEMLLDHESDLHPQQQLSTWSMMMAGQAESEWETVA